jgi:hypothetical protein
VIKVRLLLILPFLLIFAGISASVCGQEEDNETSEVFEVTTEDLEAELDLTLDSIRTHFEDVQKHLDEAGVERDPALDEAIKELGKEQQSLMDTFEGLGSLLLKVHSKLKKEGDQQSTTTIEDLEDEFLEALTSITSYIEEREESAEGNETGSETAIEDELKRLQEDEEFIEGVVEHLASALADAWQDVIFEWGDALKEWQSLVKDLLLNDE